MSNFDAQNPVIGSLLREIDIGIKDTLSDLLKKSPALHEVVLRHRFKKLKEENLPFNRGGDDDDDDDDGYNNDGGFEPPPSPLRFNVLTALPLSPTRTILIFIPKLNNKFE